MGTSHARMAEPTIWPGRSGRSSTDALIRYRTCRYKSANQRSFRVHARRPHWSAPGRFVGRADGSQNAMGPTRSNRGLGAYSRAPQTQSIQSGLKSALDQIPESQKDLLARQLGHDSFEAVLQASTVVTLSDGSTWWITADRNGAWTAWNLCTLPIAPAAEAGETAVTAG